MARIAVVEDNPSLRKLMTLMLEKRGHEVRAFEHGATALPEAQEGPFDLVLSDVQMPRLDGISLTKALRSRYSKGELPIILVSVLDAEDDVVRALEAGANDYIIKPFTAANLGAKVEFALVDEPAPEAPVADTVLPETPPLPCVYDKYVLEDRIGEGGFAEVFRARRRRDGLIVALKVLREFVRDEYDSLARYFRETASLAEVRSPAVVRIIDSGYESGRFFLAMEHIEGVSVRDRLEEETTFPVEETVHIGAATCDALAVLHDRRLVHRDVKPANIMITPEGRIVLIDFGLAKGRAEQGLTNPDEIVGTAEYVAPEVVRGDVMEHPGSDLYSLGVAMWEMLVGSRPFAAESDYKLLALIAQGDPATPVHRVRRDVPPAISQAIARLTDPDHRARFRDAREAAAALRALL